MEPIPALAFAERQLAVAESKAEAWRRIVEGLHGLNGDAPLFVMPESTGEEVEPTEMTVTVTRVQNGRPKGMQAIRRLVAERPGIWTLREFHEEFLTRGWQHTDDKRKFHAAVDSAVYRLSDLGEGRKVAPGTFEFPVPDEHQEVLGA